MKRIPLHFQIIIGLIAGVIWAVLSAHFGWSDFTRTWIAPWGTIFLNLLKLIAVPLVLFSIIKGVSGLGDPKGLGRIGAKTLGLYLLTTIFSVSVGLLLVNTIQPGYFTSEEQRQINRLEYERYVSERDGVELLDGLPQTTPEDNPFGDKIEAAEKLRETSPLQFLVDLVPENVFFSLQNNTRMLQIIFFAIFFGLALLFIPPDRARPVIAVVDGITDALIRMVEMVMTVAPYFVFALMAGQITEMAGDSLERLFDIIFGLGWYSLTVTIGLGLMLFIFYPLIVVLISKQISYRDFFRGMSPAQLLAFSTSSSAATLPVTMECVQDNLGVSKEVTSFVLPIGATINMDGTSLYQAVAAVFLAQMFNIELTLMQQLTIVLTATLASIGTPAIPSAGIVMLMIVLESVGLNPAWIAIIFPVDRILDMMRTTVNVTGDAAVSTIIASTEGKLNYPKDA